MGIENENCANYISNYGRKITEDSPVSDGMFDVDENTMIRNRYDWIPCPAKTLDRKGTQTPRMTSSEPPHDKTNKMACAPSEDSDQPGHPPSLISVFAVRMKKAWVSSYQLSAQRRLWLDWADAQADLSLRWVRSHIVGFFMSRLKYKTAQAESQPKQSEQKDITHSGWTRSTALEQSVINTGWGRGRGGQPILHMHNSRPRFSCVCLNCKKWLFLLVMTSRLFKSVSRIVQVFLP